MSTTPDTTTVDLDAPVPYFPTLTLVPDETPTLLDVVPVVEQEANGDITHQVQLTLTDVQWRMLVGDIARRLHDIRGANTVAIWALLHRAGEPRSSIEREDALTDLVKILSGTTFRGSAHSLPPQWDLSPEDAGALALALAEASEDPVECGCGNVVQQPTQLTNTCGVCVDRLGGNR